MDESLILSERARFDGETGAAIMRNRCAFTSRDMADDWAAAFTYAVVAGWDGAMQLVSEKFEWDEPLVEFLRDSHRRFQTLAERMEI